MNPPKIYLGDSLYGYNIVFTGFNDPILEQKLKNKGATVYPTITDKKTDLVITKDLPYNITTSSAKIKIAVQKNIPILSKLSIENWITS